MLETFSELIMQTSNTWWKEEYINIIKRNVNELCDWLGAGYQRRRRRLHQCCCLA